MSTSSFTARIVLAAFATTLAGSARADACEALLGAMIKLAGTPHRLYATQTTPLLGNKPRETQSVVADKTMWILASSGKWHAMPYDMPAAIETARRMPDAHACQHVRDEPVNGEAASLFTVRSKTEFGTVDSQIWSRRRATCHCARSPTSAKARPTPSGASTTSTCSRPP